MAEATQAQIDQALALWGDDGDETEPATSVIDPVFPAWDAPIPESTFATRPTPAGTFYTPAQLEELITQAAAQALKDAGVNTPKHRRPKRLNPTEQAKIVKLHNEGYQPKEIAAEIGASVNAVHTFISRSSECQPMNHRKKCKSCGNTLKLVCHTKGCGCCE